MITAKLEVVKAIFMFCASLAYFLKIILLIAYVPTLSNEKRTAG